MTRFELGWFDLGWLLLFLDLTIVAILIPTIILQRRESGATLAWILVIVLVPFLGLLAFWRGSILPTRRALEALLPAPALDRFVASLASLYARSQDQGKVADRYRERPGGYTRVLKLRHRTGDAAPISIVELVDGQPGGSGAAAD